MTAADGRVASGPSSEAAPYRLPHEARGDGPARDATAIRWLGLLSGLFLAARVVYIARVPDLDGDAYAHFAIGRAVLRAPGDLGPHWVWLPGYHFFLALLQRMGAEFVHVRLVNAVLQAVGPLLLFKFARLHHGRGVAFLAAASWCVCSLPNLLGTSALGEVTFTLLILGATFAIHAGERDARRSALGGVLLTLACAMRYEASFSVAALGVAWLVDAARVRRFAWSRAPAFLVPMACVLGYVIWRRYVVDHQWFWFVRETLAFTTMQRGVLARSRLYEVFWFPLVLPLKLVGPALALAPIGALVRPAAAGRVRFGAIVPAAIAVFLLSVYAGNGILGLARYWSVLLPFTCLLIARAACWTYDVLGRARGRLVVSGVLASFLVTTFIEVRAGAREALRHEEELRAWEAKVNGA